MGQGGVDHRAAELARRLIEARSTGIPVPRAPDLAPSLGHAVRTTSIALLTDDGAIPITAYKVSLSTGTWGALTADVVLREPVSLPRRGAIDPLLEGELAFLVETELSADCTVDEVLAGCRVAVAIEVADSRWEGWHPGDPASFVPPTGPEIEADNAVSGWLILGDRWEPAADLPLPDLAIAMHASGRRVAFGQLRDVMGHPAGAVSWLIRQLATEGRTLDVGQVVSSGCPWTELVTVPPTGGTWEAVVEGIGSARVTFT